MLWELWELWEGSHTECTQWVRRVRVRASLCVSCFFFF